MEIFELLVLIFFSLAVLAGILGAVSVFVSNENADSCLKTIASVIVLILVCAMVSLLIAALISGWHEIFTKGIAL